MDKLIVSLEKENPYEVIDKGELVEVNIETNKYRKCQNKLSPYVIGVCSDEWEISDEIPYYISNDEGDYSLSSEKSEDLVNVQVGGLALVKTTGVICIGDLLVSSEVPGVAKAVRYKHDWENLDKIIGKVFQLTENEDECIALISQL